MGDTKDDYINCKMNNISSSAGLFFGIFKLSPKCGFSFETKNNEHKGRNYSQKSNFIQSHNQQHRLLSEGYQKDEISNLIKDIC